jgi:hypothetical protein
LIRADTGAPPTIAAVRGEPPLAEPPNGGVSVSVGTHRRSSLVRVIGPMDPDGRVLNFSSAAALIRVRNRSKDLRRSVSVEGTVRPDAVSNASFDTAQLIRRLPSRISKLMRFPSREETVFDVLLIMNTFHNGRSGAPAIALHLIGWFLAVPRSLEGSSVAIPTGTRGRCRPSEERHGGNST